MGRSSGLTGDDVYAILHNKVGSDEGGSGQDGVGISSIVKTGTEGLVDTYTITLTNNSTYTFTVTNGASGTSATIAVGTVTTGDAGSDASVTNVGTENNAVLNFTIPRGENGENATDEQVKSVVEQYFQENPVSGMTESQIAQLNKATADILTKVDIAQGAENAGKVLGIDESGNVTPVDVGLDEQAVLEKSIENYYALRRTGKVYQTKLWKYATNPSSTGEKLLDNEGLVFEPSTDTSEGQDDYLDGTNPLFEWVNVNYTRDDDGTARPTAIEGTDDYQTEGSVDVGVMQMSFWWKWDSSNEEYDLITISDTPHPELGLVPWCECVKEDGTVLPWCIGSKYVSGLASDGLLRSQPGLKPERLQSHNGMITNYQAKGAGYWGAGACRNTFQIIFNAIKGGTKNSQTLFGGCTSYSYQYEAAVQSAETHTYFPVTNAQAANLVVGSYVSVGYGSDNDGTANTDRGQTTVHAYADDVKILSIEELDGDNMAVYLDIPEESAFSTTPYVHSESLSAPIILSTMHWWSGSTDSVKGRHDGSLESNTDNKHPYRVQGREYAVGAYTVASDVVMSFQSDYSKNVYVAPKGVAHSSTQATIESTYTMIGNIHAEAEGADWWVGDVTLDNDTGAWYPSAVGGSSSQGMGDMCYGGGTSTSGTREYLQGGSLGGGSHAGAASLNCWYWLGGGSWNCAACD